MVQKIIQTIKKVTTIPKRSEFKSSREYALQVETSLNEHKEFNNDLVEFVPKLSTAIDEINATTEQIVLNKTATDEALASVQNSKTNIEQTIEASKTDMAQTIQTAKDDISGTIQTAKGDINTSVANAKQSEDNAKQSELNAKQSETNTSQSEANAGLSETNAKQSELNAKQSELNASNIVLGQVFDDNTETNQTGWSSTKIKQEINAIPKVDAYTKTQSDGKYLGKTQKAVDSDKLDGLDSSNFLRSNARAVDTSKVIGLDPHTGIVANSVTIRDSNADVHARLFRSNYGQDNIGVNSSLVFRNNQSDNYLRFANKESIKNYLKDLGIGGSKMFVQASDNLIKSFKIFKNTKNGFYCEFSGVYRVKIKITDFKNYASNDRMFLSTNGQQLPRKLGTITIDSYIRDSLIRSIFRNASYNLFPTIGQNILTMDIICFSGDFILFNVLLNENYQDNIILESQIDVFGSLTETPPNYNIGTDVLKN